MELADLKRLALAAQMHQLDLSPGYLTLQDVTNDAGRAAGSDAVLAWYRSPYASAGTWALGKFGDPVAVRAKDFVDAVGLFDAGDNPIELKTSRGFLHIKSARREAKLKVFGTYDMYAAETMRAIGRQCAIGASVSAETFMPEAVLAASMAAPKTMQGILTGLRVRTGKDVIVLQSTNGSAVFQTMVEAEVTAPIDVVIPAEDMVTAMRLIGRANERLLMSATERNLSFVTAFSAVRIPSLMGNWPPLSKIAQQQLSEPITVPSSSIRKLAAAARLYQLITWFHVKPHPQGIVLATPPVDGGSFEELVEGQRVDREYQLGMTDMDGAAKLGHSLEIRFGENAARVSVPGTNRLVYTLLRRPG